MQRFKFEFDLSVACVTFFYRFLDFTDENYVQNVRVSCDFLFPFFDSKNKNHVQKELSYTAMLTAMLHEITPTRTHTFRYGFKSLI